MTDIETAPAAIRTYFEAINSEDWERLATVWHEDAELRAVGARPRRGRAEIGAYFPKTLAPWRRHLDDPVRVAVAGDVVTVEIHFVGSTDDGRAVEFDAVDVFDLEAGRIRRLSTWYDVDAVRRRLPVPTPPAISEYFRCLNAEDWPAFERIWHPDAEVLLAGARPRRGLEHLMGLYRKLFDAWPRHHDEPGRVLRSGSTCTVEVAFTGTTAAGRSLAFDAVDVIDLADGQLLRLTNWYDTSYVRNQSVV